MAEEEDKSSKTEEPTNRRLRDAQEKGQVARSLEVTSWAMLVAGSLVVLFLAPWVMEQVTLMSIGFIADAHSYPLDFEHFRLLFARVLWDMGLLLGPVVALFFIVSLGSTLAQVGWTFSPEKIQFRFSAISPLKGLKRIFGVRGLTEFAKGLVKIGIVGVVFIIVSVPLIGDVEVMPLFSLAATLERMQEIALIFTLIALAIMTVLAALDYLYQRWDHIRNLRMSKQELRDEYKQQEGDPQVKRRIAQARMERAQSRMMAAVAKADVVITNPTHYAVALAYDMKTMAAPRLVGKGVDDIAKKIREVADENDIPIVENPPLARAIYATVELDHEIPPQYYHAVAEVISYVFRLIGRMPRQPGERLVPPKPDWSLDPDAKPDKPTRN
jgi:flagellar biosynthetic protein FlhB